MSAVVAEAKFARAPVAPHASCPDGVLMVAKAPVTTIEHRYEKSKYDQAFRIMKEECNNICADFVRAGVFSIHEMVPSRVMLK